MKAVNETVNKAEYDYPYIGRGTDFENNPLHFHNELEILYVRDGEILITLEAENKALKKGDICIILPGQLHTLLQIGQIDLSVIKLFPALPLYGAAMAEYVFGEGAAHYAPLHEAVARLLAEDEERSIGYQLAVRTACDALTLYILRTLAHSTEADASLERQTFGAQLFESANDYIEQNFSKKITLDTVATAFGYSHSYFSRLFKAVCGMNFFDYLSIFRLKKSTALLQNSDLKIESVAFSCGYNSLRSYNRAFQKYFGQSPGNYRKLFLSQSKSADAEV